jgi:hypothetical protein
MLKEVSKEEILTSGFTEKQYENAEKICQIAKILTGKNFVPTVVDCLFYFNAGFIMNSCIQYNSVTNTINSSQYKSTNFTKLNMGTLDGINNIDCKKLLEIITPFLKNKNYSAVQLKFTQLKYEKYLTINDIYDKNNLFYRDKQIFPNIKDVISEKLINNKLVITLPTSFYIKYIKSKNMIIIPENKYPKLVISGIEKEQKSFCSKLNKTTA